MRTKPEYLKQLILKGELKEALQELVASSEGLTVNVEASHQLSIFDDNHKPFINSNGTACEPGFIYKKNEIIETFLSDLLVKYTREYNAENLQKPADQINNQAFPEMKTEKRSTTIQIDSIKIQNDLCDKELIVENSMTKGRHYLKFIKAKMGEKKHIYFHDPFNNISSAQFSFSLTISGEFKLEYQAEFQGIVPYEEKELSNRWSIYRIDFKEQYFLKISQKESVLLYSANDDAIVRLIIVKYTISQRSSFYLFNYTNY